VQHNYFRRQSDRPPIGRSENTCVTPHHFDKVNQCLLLFLFVVCLVAMNDFPQKTRMSALISHLNEAHDQDLSYEHLTFETDELFNEWLWKIERDVPCSFNKTRLVRNKNHEYYTCNRSRVSQYFKATSIPRKRKLKVQGRSFAGFTCPAHIKRYRMVSGDNKVQFIAKHFCNTNKLKQLGHIRLNEQDRMNRIPNCISYKIKF